MEKLWKSKDYLRNQTENFWKSKYHFRNQTDKIWKSKNRLSNQKDKQRIKTNDYFSDTPRTPYFECCWLEEGMATKVFIPRVLNNPFHALEISFAQRNPLSL